MRKKGSAITDFLPWLIIFLLLLVLSVIAILVFTKQGNLAIDKIKDFLKIR